MGDSDYVEEECEDPRPSTANSEGSGSPFEGFAQAISALKKLNQLESDIATIISSCRVPLREARKFLRCTTPEQVANISLFQYMKALFMQLGIDIDVSEIEPYAYYFIVKDSAISELYSGTTGRTCHLVCEAIARFFNRDLNLSVSVEEIKCVNDGDELCKFETRVNKEDYCRMTLSDEEKRLLEKLSKPGSKSSGSALSPEELNFRMRLFRKFGLVNEDGEVTKLGIRCSTQFVDEEEVDSPWKSMEDITTAISSALSFAEASHLSIPIDTNDYAKGDKTLDQKEARGYKSFAELLARQAEKESESEGF